MWVEMLQLWASQGSDILVNIVYDSGRKDTASPVQLAYMIYLFIYLFIGFVSW